MSSCVCLLGGGLKEMGCGVEGALWRRAWAGAGALAVSDPGHTCPSPDTFLPLDRWGN